MCGGKVKNNWQTVGTILAILISIGTLTFNFVGENATKAERLSNAQESIKILTEKVDTLEREPNKILVDRISELQKDMVRKDLQITSLSDMKTNAIKNDTELASLKQSVDRLSDGLTRLEITQSKYATEQAKTSVSLDNLIKSNNNVADALRELSGFASRQELHLAKLDQRLSSVEKVRDRHD